MSGSDSYKYNHPDKSAWGTAQYLTLLALPLLIYLAFHFLGTVAVPVLFFLGIMVLPRTGIFGIARTLEITPRYLLCGSQIVYFRNVRALRFDAPAGRLTLEFDTGQSSTAAPRRWTLERELFPTNARKEHKIAANKDQKFQKVAQKIIAAVQAQSPQAVVHA